MDNSVMRTAVINAFERGKAAGIAEERARLIPAPSDIEHPLVWQQGYYSGLLAGRDALESEDKSDAGN